jgi:inorganic triphosphatase YgiF
MSIGLETELKLRATDAALRALEDVASLGRTRLGPARATDEVDVYLDTDDGRLAVERWACRIRSRDGRRLVSLKGPAEHAAGDPLHRRPEVEGPAPGDEADVPHPVAWPPSPARDLVLRVAGDAPLGERLTLRQHRTERAVTLGEARVATLSLDRVRVEVHGASLGGFAVAELEVAPGGADAWLGEVAASLLARPGLEPEPASKLERALELARGAAGIGS